MTGLPYLVDGRLVVDDRRTSYQALVAGRAVDIRGDSLSELTVRCDRPGTGTRVASGGWFVVTGVAARVFPTLDAVADSLTMRLAVTGRPPLELTVPLPAGTTLPLMLGDVPVPGPTVAATGRVRRADLTGAPIPGARVDFRTDAAIPAMFPLALRVGPVAGYPATTSTVRATTVAPAGAATSCPRGAPAGETVLSLAATSGIGTGTVLRIEPGGREQYARVREVIGELVVLTAPLGASLPPGAEARPVTITPTGPTRQLVRPTEPGDGFLALDADLTGDTVRITGPADESDHAVGALADAAGFYQLGGVRDVAVVAVKASAPGLAGTQEPTVWQPDERTPRNPLDLYVRP